MAIHNMHKRERMDLGREQLLFGFCTHSRCRVLLHSTQPKPIQSPTLQTRECESYGDFEINTY